MTSTHPLPAQPDATRRAAPFLAPGRTDLRDFGVMLASVFLLGAGAVTAALLHDSGEHGTGVVLAGPVMAHVALAPLGALYRRRHLKHRSERAKHRSRPHGP